MKSRAGARHSLYGPNSICLAASSESRPSSKKILDSFLTPLYIPSEIAGTNGPNLGRPSGRFGVQVDVARRLPSIREEQGEAGQSYLELVSEETI